LQDLLKKRWGYVEFKPFQRDIIHSILEGKDTIAILPTGGGKSLCFQLPALVSEGLAVVISPLISLMKDQVDDCKDRGFDAECLNSSMEPEHQARVLHLVRSGRLKLLYLSPERLLMDKITAILSQVDISFFVIDEAHCISQWGHDFRQEYRKLKLLKERFPGKPVHAFTATATQRVQDDIAAQLDLASPTIVVGSVDRPNLCYRVMQRKSDYLRQVIKIIEEHPLQAGILYCIRRSDVDELSAALNTLGYANLPYHAGLSDETRKKNQDEFLQERVDIMVATIAFGMGVDRSNIRYIVHTGMPKSVEHYQQETGRSGRDGLKADCYLFYSAEDYRVWRRILEESSEETTAVEKLNELYGYCTRPQCRHRFISEYFDQEFNTSNCGACDYCLGEVETAKDSRIIGQKILSCVLRARQGFGADHIADILKGNATDSVLRWKHDSLSTFGIMEGETKVYIRYMIEQLVGQGYLERRGEYATLGATENGILLLKGQKEPFLALPQTTSKKRDIEKRKKSSRSEDWAGVDEGLFEALRSLRARIASEKAVPAYIIFGDASLKDMALKKPLTEAQFSEIYGVGEVKLKEYWEMFTETIRRHLNDKGGA
jgi:ATP-dependent DNA helicase RecQ